MTSGLLIVGGGLAAQRCCEVLRAAGDDRPITIVGAEPVRPYDRPPLSKAVPLGDVCFRPAEWYAERGIELRWASPLAGSNRDGGGSPSQTAGGWRTTSC